MTITPEIIERAKTYDGKVIQVVDAAAGDFREVQRPRMDARDLSEVFRQHFSRGYVSLHEAAIQLEGQRTLSESPLTTTDFPFLMRAGLKPILFTEYAGFPSTHEQWAKVEPSNKQFETGVEFSNIGKLPKKPEGGEYSRIVVKADRSVQIENEARGAILEVTWEAIRYDEIGAIRQYTEDLGRAMAYTEEDDAYTELRTAARYERNSTTNDNDIGANTLATQFGPVGLTTAWKTLTSMKDRKSGRYLGVMPDTLIVGIGLVFFAKQLLNSPEIIASGDPGSTHALYGQGTTNPFRGTIKNIIVSPLMGQYEWVLGESRRFFRKTVVQDIELLEGNNTDWSYKTKKTLTYTVDKVYGVRIWNDRFAFYSTGGAGPLVG